MTGFLMWSYTRWSGLLTVAALGSFGVALALLHWGPVQAGSRAVLAAVVGAGVSRIHRRVRKRPAASLGRTSAIGGSCALTASAVGGLWTRWGVGGMELLCGFVAVLVMAQWCRPPATAARRIPGSRVLPTASADAAAGGGCVEDRRGE